MLQFQSGWQDHLRWNHLAHPLPFRLYNVSSLLVYIHIYAQSIHLLVTTAFAHMVLRVFRVLRVQLVLMVLMVLMVLRDLKV